MAEIEIENPADELLEEKAEGGDKLTLRIALSTVILAIIAVVLSHFGEQFADEGDDLKNMALMAKNDANKKRIAAANQWSYFQSKSTKQSLAENVIALSNDEGVKGKWQAKVDRYEKEKTDIKSAAEKLDRDSEVLERKVDAYSEQAEALTVPEDQIKLGMPLIQIAIALASITALTRVRWMLYIALIFAAIGVGMCGYGVYLGKQLPDHVGDWEKANADFVKAETAQAK